MRIEAMAGLHILVRSWCLLHQFGAGLQDWQLKHSTRRRWHCANHTHNDIDAKSCSLGRVPW